MIEKSEDPKPESDILPDSVILEFCLKVARANEENNPGVSYVIAPIDEINSELSPNEQLGSHAEPELHPSAIFIQMTGQFVGRMAKVPPNAAYPTGSILSYMLDSRTGQIFGWGLNDHSVDLSAIGAEHQLRKRLE